MKYFKINSQFAIQEKLYKEKIKESLAFTAGMLLNIEHAPPLRRRIITLIYDNLKSELKSECTPKEFLKITQDIESSLLQYKDLDKEEKIEALENFIR